MEISISGSRVPIFGAIFDPLVHKFHPNTVNLSRGDMRTTWPMDPLYSRLSETHHTCNLNIDDTISRKHTTGGPHKCRFA